jgi:hypothetical protein
MWKSKKRGNNMSVKSYLKSGVKTDPLIFVIPISEENETIKFTHEELKTLELDELVEATVDLTHYYDSHDLFGKHETSHNRRRSSIGIWRHIIYLRPEVTLIEVMKSLYENIDKYRSLYCYDIQKRVWRLKRNYKPDAGGDTAIFNRQTCDEYGYILDEWGTVTQESDEQKYLGE